MRKVCGIYKIENVCTHKVYIGASTDIHRRILAHRSCSGNAKFHPLYQDIRRYGLNNFVFTILEECLAEELDDKEIFYIDLFDSYMHGYNRTKGGKGASIAIKLSDEEVDSIIRLLELSDISQNDIAKMFSVGVDTISEINHGKTRRRTDKIYPIRDIKISEDRKVCPVCGKCKGASAQMCLVCAQRNRRKVDWPSEDELICLIKKYSIRKIGHMYGVSDNAVRKWCKHYEIDIKSLTVESE